MKKYKKKLATLSLLGLIGLTSFGCGSKNTTTSDLIVTPFNYESEFEDDLFVESINNTIEAKDDVSSNEEVDENTVDVISVDVVVANKKTEIFGSLDNKELIGYLPEGRTVDYVSTLDTGYYEVDYYGKTAYVSTDATSIAQVYDIHSEINKILYAVEDVNMVIPDYLSESGVQETVTIPKFECFEVYDEDEAVYLVKTEDYIGYISKENVAELNGTLVVIDISKQKLILYVDNQIIKECPIVTGTPTEERHTDEGLWEIYNITGARNLIGENGSKTPVDIMMKFHDNEGLHDASYHSCDFWKQRGKNKHGWRADWEFGGDTYLTDGSHGCCNMLRDDVFFVAEYVDIGTPVLVKK